jgi:hypothetical protein
MATKQKALRQLIGLALLENARHSNRAIARLVGCSNHTVQRVRDELEAAGKIAPFVATGGTDSKGRGITAGKLVTAKVAPPTLQHHLQSSWVYAIGPVGGGLTKIGRAWHVSGRLASVQRMSPIPLTILWHIQGSTELEARLHATFASKRAWGEWFDLGSDPVRAIKDVLGE